VLKDAASITGKKLKRIFVVGGGSRNPLLNKLTAQATGLEVISGAAESATVGNFAIQLSTLAGEYNEGTGVNASAVAKWADLLAPRPVESKAGQAEAVVRD